MRTAALSLQDYAARHDLSVRQIQTHIAAGLPVTRRRPRRGHGGRPRIYVDPVAADAWLALRGITTKGMARAAMDKTAGVKPPGAGAAAAGQEAEEQVARLNRTLLRQYGLLGALERFRYIEMFASLRLRKLLQGEASGAEIAAMQRQMAPIVAQLRQLEVAAIEYQERSGKLLDAEQVLVAGLRIAERVRSSLASLGHHVVPLLAQYLRSTEDFAAVEGVITDATREALRNLPASVFAEVFP